MTPSFDQSYNWPARIVIPLDLVTRLSMYASGMALLLITSSYVFEVIMRYFLDAPTSWSSDVIQLFFAAMIMLALPEVTRTIATSSSRFSSKK